MALTAEWFTHHRSRIACWHRDRLDEVLEDLATMQAEIQQLQQQIAGRPASVHITASQEGNPMASFAPGKPITFTATTDNAEGVALATDETGQPFTYTWTTTAGTLVAGADSTTVTISDAPLGDVTVTATNNLGFVSLPCVATVADQTPTQVTVTAS